VPLVGAEYRAAVAFAVLLGVLLLRPRGLLGTRE
jgi:branched-chain amino acid transport system permease protein